MFWSKNIKSWFFRFGCIRIILVAEYGFCGVKIGGHMHSSQNDSEVKAQDAHSFSAQKGGETMQQDNTEYAGFTKAMGSQGWTFTARLRLFFIILTSLVIVPLQYLILKIIPDSLGGIWWRLPNLWHRSICFFAGVRVHTIGKPEKTGPVLFVANHISWLDIMLLGSCLPNASFVAKHEISGWGAAGWLAGLQRTLFVNRTRRTDSANQRDRMVARLKRGHNMIMFPEATSTDGVNMVPFKSALFSVAEVGDEATDHHLKIQPITISYSETNGMPMIRSQAPLVAWLGDVELLSHVRNFLAQARTTAVVEYHAPVTLGEFGHRKKLASYCEEEIKKGLERARRAEYRFGPQVSSLQDA